MRRTLRGLLFACVATYSVVTQALAHSITVDGNAADWHGVPALTNDLGRIARDAQTGGEYVWRDAAGDARPGWVTRPHDLRELRLTGDPDGLLIMAVLAAPIATSGDSVPQLQIAVDLDRFSGSGATAFDGAATQVAPTAAYEYLIETRFGSSQGPRVLDATGTDVGAFTAAAISATGTLECRIPWSAFGLANPPVNPVRFSAALFLTDANDVPLAPPDAIASRAADVVTQYAGPGSTGTTANEVTDGVLDYSFDLYFDVRGEVVAPVLISEVYFGGGVKQQWLEVVNATQDVVPLSKMRIGDAETPNDGEAMAQFPSRLLSPGENFVVARNGTQFFADHSFRANAECESSDGATPDMLPYAIWAATTQFNIPASGDQVLLLDAANTLIDVVTFKNPAYPGVNSHPGVPALHSLERLRPDRDTDDCAADFGDEPAPTPGYTGIVTSGVDGSTPTAIAWRAPYPNPAHDRVRLALALPRATALEIDVLDIAGRRVTTLLATSQAPAGESAFVWDGRDANARPVESGLYFVRARTPEATRIQRITLLR